MICPICGNEMEKGKLYGGRYTLKWLPYDKELFLGTFAIGSDKIDSRTKKEKSKAPFVRCDKCTKCRRYIVDLV